MASMNIKKGDKIMVISGKDKGKTGKVIKTEPADSKIIVEGVNMTVKHKKPRGRYQQGGLINQEAPMYSCKAMVVCKGCGRPTRVGKRILEDGSKVRVCRNTGCGEQLDS